MIKMVLNTILSIKTLFPWKHMHHFEMPLIPGRLDFWRCVQTGEVWWVCQVSEGSCPGRNILTLVSTL